MISELLPYLTIIHNLHSSKINKNQLGKNSNESFLVIPEP